MGADLNIWEQLGIAPTHDAAEIRRAYAARVKQVNPEDDAEAFQRLRAAYEFAMNLASMRAPGSSPVAVTPEGGPALRFPADRPYALPAYYAPANVTYRIPGLDTERVPGHGRSMPAVREAVTSVIEQLQSAPVENRPQVLADAMKRDGWQHLDFREQFQNDAAHVLMIRFEDLIELVPLFAAEFSWAQRQKFVHGSRISELLGRYEARRWRLRIETDEESRYSGKQEALQWLRMPLDEPAFRQIAADGSALPLVRNLLDELRRDCPAALRYEVNRDAVQWWTHLLEVRSKARASSKPVSSWPGYFWILPVIFMLSRCLSDNIPHSTYSPPVPLTSYAPSSHDVTDVRLATPPDPVWGALPRSPPEWGSKLSPVPPATAPLPRRPLQDIQPGR